MFLHSCNNYWTTTYYNYNLTYFILSLLPPLPHTAVKYYTIKVRRKIVYTYIHTFTIESINKQDKHTKIVADWLAVYAHIRMTT